MKNPATHYPHHLGFRAILLAVLAVVSLLLAEASWRSYQMARDEILRSETDTLQLAKSVSAYQQSLLDHTAHLLRVLGGISLPQTDNSTDCNAFLARQLERFPEYDNLMFADPNGSVKCSAHSTQISFPVRGFSSASSSMPLLLSLNRDYLLFVLPQLSADGHVDGMVMASLPAARFFRTKLAPIGAEFALIDGSGRLVSTYPSSTAWVSTDPLFDQAMLALSPGTITPLSGPDSMEWLHVSEPVDGTAQGLKLLVRLPADVALAHFMQMAAFTVAALAVAGLSLWMLFSQAVVQLNKSACALIRKHFAPMVKIRNAAAMIRERTHRLRRKNAESLPDNFFALQNAYEDLKNTFAQETERMRQIVLLDELSQVMQGSLHRSELAETVARCATNLFPGCGGALLLKTTPEMVETIFAWGGSSHQQAFHLHDCLALHTGLAYPAQQPGAGLCAHMKEKTSDYVCLPLIENGEVLGVLHLARLSANVPDQGIHWAAASIAERTAIALSALKRRKRLQFRATRDVLTGLYNRRFMEEALVIEQRRANRRKSSIGVMMVDVDFFKRFNDTFGHDAGDALLNGIGHILRDTVREGDMPCRYGGEEFVVILPGADIEDTRQRAETLRATIERWAPQHQGSSFGPVTVSIGIAAFPRNGNSWQTALKAADQALYEAKDGGRNRVVSAPTNHSTP